MLNRQRKLSLRAKRGNPSNKKVDYHVISLLATTYLQACLLKIELLLRMATYYRGTL